MAMCDFSSRKRSRTYGESTSEVLDHNTNTLKKKHESRHGRIVTYQLAFCLGVLLIQLARVHSWSPSSPSSIAKKTTPSAAVQIPGESDPLSRTRFADRRIIPSSEELFSSDRNHDPAIRENSNNALKMAVSSPGSHQSVGPSMLTGDDSFFPIGSRTARPPLESINIGTGKTEKSEEGRVLGFDVFQLHAKNPESSAGEETSASSDDSESLLSGSGLTWQNLPLSTTANDREIPSPAAIQLTDVSTSLATGSGHRNGGVRLLRYSSPLLPAWFPWIPTKSQIMTLKLKELREACSQRGLAKSGNKDVLQERLCGWTIEHQMQHQARLSGDLLSACLEHDDYNDPTSFLREKKKQNDDDGEHNVTGQSGNTPNSLAEWSRSFDAEKLTQKRQEIIRQKRVGKKTNTFSTSSTAPTGNFKSNHNNDFKNKKRNTEDPTATKEYLTKLSNAMKTSPSSPYASNRDVRELYDASKKADQLGEPLLAIELLESLVKLTPNDARIYRRLSRMHNDQGNLNVARATLQEGIRKLPHNPWLWHGMGQLELAQGRTDYGIRCYQRAIQEDPAFAHSYHAWGIHEFNNGQIAKAMKILKRGIEYCPTNHRLHHALGDLYRGAKLPRDAERSYRRALEEGPPVSHSFALSALASVAYEHGNVEEARRWLYQSIETNNGRHAQGWLSLVEIEEAEGNVERALKVCEAAIIRYEKELVESRKRYKRDSGRMNHHRRGTEGRNPKHKHHHRHRSHREEPVDLDKSFMDPTKSVEVERGLLKSIPKYRSGDKFLALFRHWARLEGRYGTYDGCNRIYKRASVAFPLDHKISLDWARYHTNIRSRRARQHFSEACRRSSTRYAEPYREYASFEMSLGEYEQARKIFFRGAQAVTRSPDGSTGRQNQRELARLYVEWAVCEWHLRNIPRAEVLFDHALRLTEVDTEEGSELRSFVLFCLAQLECYERDELHRAQHCIGLCLKENSFPGGNAPVWNLWATIACELGNPHLGEKCLNEANRCKLRLETLKEEEQGGSSALDTMNMLKGSQNIQDLMRQKPWFDQLQVVRRSWGEEIDGSSMSSSASPFFSSIRIPSFENHEFQRQANEEVRGETRQDDASVVTSE